MLLQWQKPVSYLIFGPKLGCSPVNDQHYLVSGLQIKENSMSEENLNANDPVNEENIEQNKISGSAESDGYQSSSVQMEPLPETPQVMEDQSSHTGRKIAVSLLVVLGLLLLFVANLAFWARFTLLNTNGWVNAVGPLTKDPQIAQVLGVYVADEIFEATDIDQAMTEMLPAEFQLLSAPLSNAMQGLVEEAVAAFIESDVVNAVWITTNRVAHSLIVSVLRGEGDILYLETGQLVIDVSPLINVIEDTFGIQNLELGMVDEDGRIVLLENQQVAYLQQVIALLDAIGLLLPLLSLVVLIIAVFLSLWRRKTTLWIGIGIVITMLLSLLVYQAAESWLLVSIADPLVRLFGGAIWDVITNGLIIQTIVLMIIGLLIIVGAWLMGSNRTAVSIRSKVRGWRNG
jgi:hypothetical protein